MREHGLNPISYSVDFNIPYEDKIQIFNRIFNEHPDVEGIFASNDLDAALIMKIAKSYNKKIPEDLLLVGYDGTKIMRTVFSELTTIIQPIDQISTKAIEVLNDRMENKDTLKEYIFPVTVWEGGTC